MRFLLLLLAAAIGCSGQLPTPRSEGERLYRARCTGCHRAYDPAERTDWPRVVDKMQAEHKTRLTAEEREQIVGFLSGTATLH